MKKDSAGEQRRLLEEIQAALEMVRSGCERGLRALEAWRAANAEGEAGGAVEKGSRPVPAPPVRSRVPAKKWEDLLEAAVSRLPEVFTKADLVRELGYQPTRGTLLRIIDLLLLEKRIKILQGSDGGTPTTYRKVAGAPLRQAAQDRSIVPPE